MINILDSTLKSGLNIQKKIFIASSITPTFYALLKLVFF